MKNYKKALIYFLIIFSVLLIGLSPAQAGQKNWLDIEFPDCFDTSDPSLKKPCEVTDFIALAYSLTKAIFAISGSLALLFLIFGGVIWLVSAGNAEMVAKGKKIIVGSLIGLVIVISSWVLINTVIIGLTGQEIGSIGEIFTKDWNKVEGTERSSSSSSSPTSSSPPAEDWGCCFCEPTETSLSTASCRMTDTRKDCRCRLYFMNLTCDKIETDMESKCQQ